MKTDHTNEYALSLIIDEIDGVISSEGKEYLRNWAASNPENERVYREFYSLNHRMDSLVDESGESTEAIEANHKTPWLSIAATTLILFCIAFYFTSYILPETIHTATNEQKKIDLPDGSSLTLNGNTTVKYHKSGYKASRKITLLEGEAFFNVVHNPNNAFVVDLGKIKVTDLGTSFNIKRSESDVSVVVSSGRVAFENTETRKSLFLNPGHKGIYQDNNAVFSKTMNQDINYKAWTDKKLKFVNTPIEEVAALLENVYGCKVVLNQSSLKGRKLNASLNYKTPDSALLVISESLRIKVKKNDNQFILGY